MIKVTHAPDTNLVELLIDGEIAPQQFDETLAKVKAVIDKHGKIRILKEVRSLAFPPIPLSRFWDDLKFGFEHLSDITHAAVVSDLNWVESLARLYKPLFKMEIRSFKNSELEQARQWLRTAK